MLENMVKKSGRDHSSNGSGSASRTSRISRLLSQRSYKHKNGESVSDNELHNPIEKDVEIQWWNCLEFFLYRTVIYAIALEVFSFFYVCALTNLAPGKVEVVIFSLSWKNKSHLLHIFPSVGNLHLLYWEWGRSKRIQNACEQYLVNWCCKKKDNEG